MGGRNDTPRLHPAHGSTTFFRAGDRTTGKHIGGLVMSASEPDRSGRALAAGSAYHEHLAESWSKGYAAGSFLRRLDFLKNLLADRVRAGDKWLDAGCGTGVVARTIETLGADVIGVDASPEMVAHARRDTAASSTRIQYTLVESIERLPLPDSLFDGVLCSSVVEYVDAPDDVFRECHRVLRPGGVFVVSVPNRFSLIRSIQTVVRHIGRLCGASLYDYLSVSHNAYSRRGIQQALRHAGFAIEDVSLFSPLQPYLLVPLGLGALWVVVARRHLSPAES